MSELPSRIAMLFHLLRAKGLQLGPGDLLDLHRAIGGGFGVGSVDRLRYSARALCATRPEEQRLFDQLYDEAVTPVAAELLQQSTAPPGGSAPQPTSAANEMWAPVPIPDAFRPPEREQSRRAADGP